MNILAILVVRTKKNPNFSKESVGFQKNCAPSETPNKTSEVTTKTQNESSKIFVCGFKMTGREILQKMKVSIFTNFFPVLF